MRDFYCNQVLSGTLAVEVVYETKHVLAFHHTTPFFETHIVIIPKQHIDSMAHAINPELALDMMQAIHHVVAEVEACHGGCRVSSNVGDYQTTKHLHWYVHAGPRLRDEEGRDLRDSKLH